MEMPCLELELHRHHNDQIYRRVRSPSAVHSSVSAGGGLRGRNDNSNKNGSSGDDKCYRCVPRTAVGDVVVNDGLDFSSEGARDGVDGGGDDGDGLRGDGPLGWRGWFRRVLDRPRQQPRREHNGKSEEDDGGGVVGTGVVGVEKAGSLKGEGGGGGRGAGEALAAGVAAALLGGVAAAAAAAATAVAEEKEKDEEGGFAGDTTTSSSLGTSMDSRAGRRGAIGGGGGGGGGDGGDGSAEGTFTLDARRREEMTSNEGSGGGRERVGGTGVAPDAASTGELFYRMSPKWGDHDRLGIARALQVNAHYLQLFFFLFISCCR